jgi:uncharacterized membrane protein YczE
VFTVPPVAQVRPRLGRLVIGLVCCGTGIALMVLAHLGLSPWDVLHQGIARHTGIGIGTVGIGVGMLVLVLWLPLRQRLGVGTVLNVILIGLVVDGILAVAGQPGGLAVRVVYLVAGVVAFGIGSGIYIGVDLGAGPRDGLMTALASRTGLSVRLVRTVLELAALAGGWALGGNIGPGTLLFAVAIGPLVQLCLNRLSLAPLVTTIGDSPAA